MTYSLQDIVKLFSGCSGLFRAW